MSAREEEILAIIKRDPMISQNDLAKQLGITRSSVSVHITSLMKKGLIKGRGYVIPEELYPVIIGAVNVDFIGIVNDQSDDYGTLDTPIIQEDSNIYVSYGGIAKNIAEELVRLGMSPKIISPIARDIFGNEIVRECTEHGISVEGSLFLDNVSSSMYFELRTSGRSQYTGLTNVTIEKLITPQYLETKFSLINNASQIVVEDGLNGDTLSYVSKRYADIPVLLLASNHVNRVDRHKNIMDQFDFLLLPPGAAQYVTGIKHPNPADDDKAMLQIMENLLERGAQKILVPFSGHRIAFGSPEGIYVISVPPERYQSGSYSTYRDIMMSGVVFSCSKRWSVEKMLKFIAASTELYFRENKTVNTFTTDTIEQLEKNYNDAMITHHHL